MRAIDVCIFGIDCVGNAKERLSHTFSNVSASVQVLFKATISRTFENVFLAKHAARIPVTRSAAGDIKRLRRGARAVRQGAVRMKCPGIWAARDQA